MAQTVAKAMVQWLVAGLLIALLGGVHAAVICNIECTKLNLCRAAITGKNPLPPTRSCCAVLRKANLPCLCGYKSQLPAAGIDPRNALALPHKCGLKTPPECRGNLEFEWRKPVL